MPATSRFQIAKPDIVAHFDGLSMRVLRSADITSILDEKREFWRLTKSTTVTTFINDLARKGKLRAIGLWFPQGAVDWMDMVRFPSSRSSSTWFRTSLSHYTAVRIHGLTSRGPRPSTPPKSALDHAQ